MSAEDHRPRVGFKVESDTTVPLRMFPRRTRHRQLYDLEKYLSRKQAL